MNGLVVHKTNWTTATNNTIYGNGEVPTLGSSEDGWQQYVDSNNNPIAWKNDLVLF